MAACRGIHVLSSRNLEPVRAAAHLWRPLHVHAQALSKDPPQNLAEHNFRRNWGYEAPPRPERMAQSRWRFSVRHPTARIHFLSQVQGPRNAPFLSPGIENASRRPLMTLIPTPAKVGPSIGIMSNCSSSGIPGFNLKPPSLASIRMKRGHARPGIRL